MAFRKYRLLSGFLTLGCLVDALLARGVFLEESILSRWQHGKRIPRDRGLLMILVEIFARRGGLRSASEANEFLELAGQGYLTMREERELFGESCSLSKIPTIEYCHLINHYKNLFIDSSEKQKNEILKSDSNQLSDCIDLAIERNDVKTVITLWSYLGPFLWRKGDWVAMKISLNKILVFLSQLNFKSDFAELVAKEYSWLCYWQGDITEADHILRNSRRHLVNNSAVQMMANLRLAKIMQSRNQINQSNSILSSLVKKFAQEKNQDKLSDVLTYIGENYWIKNDLQKSIQYFEKAKKIALAIDDQEQNAIILTRLGGIEIQKLNYKKAEEYFLESKQVENHINRKVGGDIWNNLGIALSKKLSGDTPKNDLVLQATNEITRLNLKKSVTDKTSIFFKALGKELDSVSYFSSFHSA